MRQPPTGSKTAPGPRLRVFPENSPEAVCAVAARLARRAKPRPVCRRTIERLGLRPVLHRGQLWGLLPSGRRMDLSDGMRLELARMVMEKADHA